MGTDHTQTARGGFPEDPADLLPEESVLSLDDYLAMHAAVGHRTRYEVLYRLVHTGDRSPKELENAIVVDDSTLTTTSINSLTSDLWKNGSKLSVIRTDRPRTTERRCSEG